MQVFFAKIHVCFFTTNCYKIENRRTHIFCQNIKNCFPTQMSMYLITTDFWDAILVGKYLINLKF